MFFFAFTFADRGQLELEMLVLDLIVNRVDTRHPHFAFQSPVNKKNKMHSFTNRLTL